MFLSFRNTKYSIIKIEKYQKEVERMNHLNEFDRFICGFIETKWQTKAEIKQEDNIQRTYHFENNKLECYWDVKGPYCKIQLFLDWGMESVKEELYEKFIQFFKERNLNIFFRFYEYIGKKYAEAKIGRETIGEAAKYANELEHVFSKTCSTRFMETHYIRHPNKTVENGKAVFKIQQSRKELAFYTTEEIEQWLERLQKNHRLFKKIDEELSKWISEEYTELKREKENIFLGKKKVMFWVKGTEQVGS